MQIKCEISKLNLEEMLAGANIHKNTACMSNNLRYPVVHMRRDKRRVISSELFLCKLDYLK